MNQSRLLNPYLFFYVLISLFAFSSCDDEEEILLKENGSLSVLFDNKIDDEPIDLKEYGDESFEHIDDQGQAYNISKYAYYISSIEILGPANTSFKDPLNISASEVNGYYHVISTTPNSNVINLNDIPAGEYDRIRFTVGVDEDGVQQGAAGGVLDPANGAWFWNWNAGYIGFGVEGNASNSGQEYVDWGNGFETLEGTYAIHIGGWKDVEPQPGEDPKFVNNLKTIDFDFDATINIEEGLNPEVHISVDFAELLKGIDFASTYAVHRPDLGSPFANKLFEVFELDHVHQ